MLSPAIRDRLADPDYLEQHMIAVAALRGVAEVPWYDAHFLRRFEAAKHYLSHVKPEAVDDFVAGFAPLRTHPDFAIQRVSPLFDDDRFAEILRHLHAIPEARLERHEVENFGRDIVHDLPFFSEIQRELLPLAEKLAGRALEPGYNFLSLYRGEGRCEPHLDEPEAMFTLDICLEQSAEWPIHFSRLIAWPDAAEMAAHDPSALRTDPAMRWETHALQPNEALLFCGPSQWHYRNQIAPGGFCNLLFLHYFPKGCGDLVRTERWAEHFGWPELAPLCDIFAEFNDATYG